MRHGKLENGSASRTWMDKRDNKALHWMVIPLRSIAAGEFGRYTAQFLVQAIHFKYEWYAIANNFRDHRL